MGYSSIIDSLVNEDMAGVNRKNKASDVEMMVRGIVSNNLSKVKKTCVDAKDLKKLYNKSKLGKNSKKNLIAKYNKNVFGYLNYKCLIQIYSLGKEQYITFTLIFDGYLGLGISYICKYNVDLLGSVTELDFVSNSEVDINDVRAGNYGDVVGITLYDINKDEYIGDVNKASDRIFSEFSKCIMKEIPSVEYTLEEFAEGLEGCEFSIEAEGDCVSFARITFFSSEYNFTLCIYDELESTEKLSVECDSDGLHFEMCF